MAEYLIQDTTLRAMANETRELTGVTGQLSTDAIIANLDTANTEVSSQASLIAQIKEAANNLPAVGDSSSETSYVTGTIKDTYDSNPYILVILSNGEMIPVPSGTTKSFNVPKDSMFILSGDGTSNVSIQGGITMLTDGDEAPERFSSGTKVYFVTEDFQIEIT